MTSTSTLRSWWAGYLCNTASYDRVPFPGPAGPWNLYTARAAVPAFDVFAELMQRHGYLFRESAGGTYVCRKIAGSDNYSLHAYAIAIDLNPSKNPYGSYETDMPPDFVDDVLGLRTSNGARVFTWGGNWSPASSADPMHYQIDASPADIATGIVGYDGPPTGPPTNGNDMRSLRLAVTEAGVKGWLPDQDDVDYWYAMCEKPNDPEWQDFENMWSREKQAEFLAAHS